MDVLYLATHYPLSSRHTYPDHHHPEPEVFHVDMETTDYAQSKPLSSHHLHIPATQYTSSPSIESQTDDEEKLFDVDVDFSSIHSHHNQQLMYDSSSSWANITTPRAWVGEPHKVPALEPDTHSPYGYPQENNISNLAHNEDPSNNIALYTLSDYLQNPSPAHSPLSSYMSSPGSVPLAASILPSNSYYSAPNTDVQQPSYALAARYSSSLQAHDIGCDPRFVSPAATSPHAGPSSLPSHQNVGISFADVYTDPTQSIKVEQDQQSVQMNDQYQQALSLYDSDSGEDDKSEIDSDQSYMPSRARPMSLPNASHIRSRHIRSSSAGSSTTIGLGGESLHAQRPARTPAPEPVPNLTKKSRGRRVPTAAALYGNYGPAVASLGGSGVGSGGKNTRTYVCKVKECGKCFARSEHLKRHVRSIHTNEKPHRCLHSGCNKEFSRHDNLCQHMRVHRNFSTPKDGAFGSF